MTKHSKRVDEILDGLSEFFGEENDNNLRWMVSVHDPVAQHTAFRALDNKKMESPNLPPLIRRYLAGYEKKWQDISACLYECIP